MKYKFWDLIILLLSITCLIISSKLFWNICVYVDEYNTTTSIVLGNYFWNCTYWFMLIFNFLICVLSGIKLLKKS